MSVSASAGIEFGFTSVRYAEVKPAEQGWRLLRLGQCDFDFGVSEALRDPASVDERKAISQALVEALGDSSIQSIRAVLHAPICNSFFSVSDGKGDPMDQIRLEAELLGFSTAASVDGVAADAASGGEGFERLHATAIDPGVLEVLGELVEPLGARDAQAVSGIRAAVEVARLASEETQLVLGRFSGCYEVAMIRRGRWIFARHSVHVQDPADAVYETISGLEDLGVHPDTVKKVHVYGSQAFAPTLRAVFGDRVVALNPLSLVAFDRDSLDPGYSAQEFVPALGAAIL